MRRITRAIPGNCPQRRKKKWALRRKEEGEGDKVDNPLVYVSINKLKIRKEGLEGGEVETMREWKVEQIKGAGRAGKVQ